MKRLIGLGILWALSCLAAALLPYGWFRARRAARTEAWNETTARNRAWREQRQAWREGALRTWTRIESPDRTQVALIGEGDHDLALFRMREGPDGLASATLWGPPLWTLRRHPGIPEGAVMSGDGPPRPETRAAVVPNGPVLSLSVRTQADESTRVGFGPDGRVRSFEFLRAPDRAGDYRHGYRLLLEGADDDQPGSAFPVFPGTRVASWQRISQGGGHGTEGPLWPFAGVEAMIPEGRR